MLVLRGRLDGVRAWARSGLVPVWIVPDVAWTLVVPAGPAESAPPYDDPVALLGGRPVPGRLRPVMCFVADGPRAAVTLQRGRRQDARWLGWTGEIGPHRVDDLPLASPDLLAELAGVGAQARTDRRADLREALRPDGRSGADVVDDLLRALGLPGAGLTLGAVAAGDLPGAVRIEPDDKLVQRFDRYAADEARLSAQLEEGQ
ncbi:hypothetical protein GCM10023145_19400 [Angustibacter luteus]